MENMVLYQQSKFSDLQSNRRKPILGGFLFIKYSFNILTDLKLLLSEILKLLYMIEISSMLFLFCVKLF